ncbi:hypothetical protein C2G38_2027227 [Gigaspora rosea]|uniref:Uncharacterized protein n=1 Tax=Gigaspora rosea TaxID=44941 RepID=A0A397W5J6_9GLOM|nr:hypothetical protein C2G38_2027227 [Gigaspora rosea]
MDVLAIQERIAERKLGINDNANQTALNQSKKAETLDYSLNCTREFSLREQYHLLLYMEEDISMIQNYLGIVGYTDEEMIKEEAEKDALKVLSQSPSTNNVVLCKMIYNRSNKFRGDKLLVKAKMKLKMKLKMQMRLKMKMNFKQIKKILNSDQKEKEINLYLIEPK